MQAPSLQLLDSGRRSESCGARAQLLRPVWGLPGSGIEPVSCIDGRILYRWATRGAWMDLYHYLFIPSWLVFVAHTGFSPGVALGLHGYDAQAWVTHGMWDPHSPPRGWTPIPYTGKWILNHWTTREVPHWMSLNCSMKCICPALPWSLLCQRNFSRDLDFLVRSQPINVSTSLNRIVMVFPTETAATHSTFPSSQRCRKRDFCSDLIRKKTQTTTPALPPETLWRHVQMNNKAVCSQMT